MVCLRHVGQREEDIQIRHRFGGLLNALDLEAAQNSDVNPKWLIKQCKEQKKPIPNIYMAIGDEDSLLGR